MVIDDEKWHYLAVKSIRFEKWHYLAVKSIGFIMKNKIET